MASIVLIGLFLTCGTSPAGRDGDISLAAPTAASSLRHAQTTQWEPAGFGAAGNFLNVYFDPNQSGVVYAASDVAGVFRSTDNGDHWEMRSVGLGNHEVSSFAVDPFDSDTLYAGTGAFAESAKAGIYASHDAGLTWEHLPSTFTNTITFRKYRTADAIAPDPAQQGFLLSGSRSNGMWRTEDGGLSWTPVFSNTRPAGAWMGGAMMGLAVDPSTPSTLYVTQDGGQVWKSTSNGSPGTWSATSGQPGNSSFTYALVVDDAGRVFAGTHGGGLWPSTSGGDSWERVLTERDYVYHVVSTSGAVYASTGDDANLHRSTNGGDAWEVITNFTMADHGDGVGAHGMAVAVDPDAPNHILFSRVDTWHPVDASPGIAESTDGGDSWMPYNTGLRHRNVSAMAVSPDGDLFAGTWCGGIWRRPASTTTITISVYLPLILKSSADSSPGWWQPPVNTSWQWQLTEPPIDQSFDVDMYDIDMFDNDASTVAALHAQERKVICYISVGSWEDWRPDKDQFPASVIGENYAGWPGEKWLDIRQIDLLAPIMRARFDQCKAKGFDGIEPDNIDGYTDDTGFPLTYQDQLTYNIWLANEAHVRGLSIGLKNDADQAGDLPPYFDWAMTEDCFADEWCEQVEPFTAAGKAVFAAEYTDQATTTQFLNQVCPQAKAMSFSTILKNRGLDAWRQACP